MHETIALYQKQIELILRPLGIITGNSNGNLHKYADVDRNAFSEVKKLYIRVYPSYDEKTLNQAITLLMETLYVIED